MKAKASHPLKKALIAVNPKATPAEVKVAPAIAKKKKKRKNPKAADKRRLASRDPGAHFSFFFLDPPVTAR